MAGETISILEGDTFVVSDRRGDVDASPSEPHGLFHQDTRFLSRWRLLVDGLTPSALSTDDVNYFSAQFFLVPSTDSVYTDASLSIMRKRAVGDGFHEDITVLNHTADPLELELRVEAAADFADLFEVKDSLAKKGETFQVVRDGRLVLGYRRDSFLRETWITASADEAELAEDGVRFRLRIAPHGEWTTCLDVLAAVHAFGEAPRTVKDGHGEARARPNMRFSLEEWLDAAPELRSDWRTLELTYERSLVDLAALRFYPPIVPGLALPAAGLPWFMTVFGRDSLLTSYQTLPFTPELAETTLRVLPARQGTRVDDFRDEEPGKILHEVRFGELTAFEERPHSPYYGAADSTPLFLVLLDEYERWTGDMALVRELELDARAALEWIDSYGDRDGDGYIEYERRNEESGLENQCWKDSWNSIIWNDGTLAKLPRATCEIQGYVYDAKVRTARLAREVWGDFELADRLEHDAATLKARFNRDFWIPEREFFALALDGDKCPVDTLTSNIGHLLWSGIVEDDKAEAVKRHLMGEQLFSGWGVRTMAEGEGPYNPIGYHNGTVWPHDNSFIAAGLARYGYRDEAARIAVAMLEAAEFFQHRLPEAFAGYPRAQTLFPVEYPTACSPQAWASGAPLLFVSAMLGLEPAADGMRADPSLPERIARLEVEGRRERHVPIGSPAGGGKASSPKPGHAGRKAGIESVTSVREAETATTARELFERMDRVLDRSKTHGTRGTYRFDIPGVGSWHLTVDDGDLSVREGGHEAETVVETDEETLLRIFRGEQNPTTAFMTGSLRIEGDLALVAKLGKFRA